MKSEQLWIYRLGVVAQFIGLLYPINRATTKLQGYQCLIRIATMHSGVSMAESTKVIYVDEEVPSQVLNIIKEAEKYVVVVSPWIKLWGHAENAFKIAFKKGTEVTVIVRNDSKLLESDSLTWLVNSGAKVFSADNLHAKIYFNENEVIVSSMNLLQRIRWK